METRRAFYPAVALALFLSACGGDGGSGTGPDPNPDPTPVPTTMAKVGGDNQIGTAGKALAGGLSVLIRDQFGNAMASQTVTFSVTAGGGTVSSATMSTDATGSAATSWILGTVAAATQTVRASSSTLSATFAATANTGDPSAMTKFAGDGQTGPAETVLGDPMIVVVADEFGNPNTGVTVEWETTVGSMAPTSVDTDSEGKARSFLTLPEDPQLVSVTARAPGLAPVEFTAQAAVGVLQVVTLEIEDARETLGYAAVLESTGGNGGNQWSLVAGALPTGLELRADGTIDGAPLEQGSFAFSVEVRDNLGSVGSGDLALRVCARPIGLDPGASVVLDPATSSECGHYFSAGEDGAYYRFAVVRTNHSEIASDVATIQFHATAAGATGAAAGAPPAASSRLTPAFSVRQDRKIQMPAGMGRALELARSTSAAHYAQRERERRMMEEMGDRLELLPDLGGGMVAAQTAAPASRRFDLTQTCASSSGVLRTGFLIAEDPRMAIYQDSVQNSTAPLSAANVQPVLDYYRDHGQQIIEDYFGAVSDINGDGQIVMYVTPTLGTSVAAQVWAGNMFKRDGSDGLGGCASSNEMELILFNKILIDDIVAGAAWQALATTVHEVKHVTALYHRARSILNNVASAQQLTWIEEGTAEIAGETSARSAWAAIGGPAVGSMITGQQIVDAGFIPENWGLILRFLRVALVYGEHPNSLTSNPIGSASFHDFYGSAWLFHRFLGDAYGGAASGNFADQGLFRAQSDSTTISGIDAFASFTGGQSFDALVEEWVIAMNLAGTPAPPPPRAFTTYDLLSAIEVFAGPPEADPNGFFPWPVTLTGDEDTSTIVLAAPFADATYEGSIGPLGIRFHDFSSGTPHAGLIVNVDVLSGSSLQMKIIVSRII